MQAKKLLFANLMLLISFNIFSQVGIGTTTPASSSVLDLTSSSKGFLPPRISKLNRNAITSPIAGLTIWCNNCGPSGEMQVHNGANWTNLIGGAPADIDLGESFGGGLVIYILEIGDSGYVAGQKHGLIVSQSDQGTDVEWGCHGTVIGGTSVKYGTGEINTIKISVSCQVANIAAKICYDLVLNGFNDWYLPSKDELNKVYSKNYYINIFSGTYWSSSEKDTGVAWVQDFNNGLQRTPSKNNLFQIRAIRTF